MEKPTETKHSGENGFAENECLKGRNSQIWKYHLAGWTQERIAEKLEISQPTVSRTIQSIRESIPETTREALITTEVERLDYVLAKATEVLENKHMVISQSGRIVHEITEYALDEDGNYLLDQHGNPVPKKLRKVQDDGPTLQAIDRVLSIGKERRKLLGLDSATRTEVSGPGGDPVSLQVQEFANLPAEARRERLALLQEEVQRRARAAGDVEDGSDGS